MTPLSQCLRAIGSICLAGLVLSGCATFGLGSSAPMASADAAQVQEGAAVVIADDLVGRLAEVVGPGTGTIVLRPDGSVFAGALDAALRKWGYAVATDQKVGGDAGIPLAYILDSFDGGVLARLSVPAADLGRAYALTSNGAEPSSPLSVMLRS
jgi:hypothetical protein